MFQKGAPGILVPISGLDQRHGEWTHSAFVPDPLGSVSPSLTNKTYIEVANARARLAALNSTSARLPNPGLFRMPTLRREAQSTSALEGTYAPLSDVLIASQRSVNSPEVKEVLNYVEMANVGFAYAVQGRPLSVHLLRELQQILMSGTPEESNSGKLRDTQVVIGRHSDVGDVGFPVHSARFVPPPPGLDLENRVRDLMDWIVADHSDEIDPVVALAMVHYQFETLHPFTDGNGRLGRYLIVLHLLRTGILSEPTLSVSPWFEARRAEYFDKLLAVSTTGDWDSYIRFFAAGLGESARQTELKMVALAQAQDEMHETLRRSQIRADTAHALIDFAIANTVFSVADVQEAIGLSYPRSNALIGQLVDLDLLAVVGANDYKRRFYAPKVIQNLL